MHATVHDRPKDYNLARPTLGDLWRRQGFDVAARTIARRYRLRLRHAQAVAGMICGERGQ